MTSINEIFTHLCHTGCKLNAKIGFIVFLKCVNFSVTLSAYQKTTIVSQIIQLYSLAAYIFEIIWIKPVGEV